MRKVVTLTLNPALDKSCTVDQVVAERKLRCGSAVYHPGGGGLNVARAIRELGGESAACWTKGGLIGELLHQMLDEEGVTHFPVPIREMTRENLIVFEESSGQQYRFGMPGASVTEAEFQSCIQQLRDTDGSPEYLVMSGGLPPKADDDLFARVASAMPKDCRIVLDTNGNALKQGLGEPAYLIKPNLHELAQLADKTIETDSDIKDAALSLINSGKAQIVVTSLGSAGAALTTADEHLQIRAPTVKIRSKVGAGDSTVAGIVFALCTGRSIVDAVRYGVAAGSAAVMTDGTALCRREDTDRLFALMTQPQPW